MLAEVLETMQRRVTTAMVVGMLTFGGPAPRMPLPAAPPAVVRVRSVDAGAEAWRALFPARPAPN